MNANAFHITWGTYGTRLHGDPRKTVDRHANIPGTPVLGHDPDRWERERSLLKYPPVRFTREQMIFVEEIIPAICVRGHWNFHTCAAGPDHVHVVLSTPHSVDTARTLLKRWLGQSLSERWPLGDGPDRTWWAEGGSTKPVCDEMYFRNVIEYVKSQRATRD